MESSSTTNQPEAATSRQVEDVTKGAFRFECNGCGDCCRGGGNVHFSEDELHDLKEFLKLSEEQWLHLKDKLIQFKKNELFVHSSSKACIFIDRDNLCRIYPVRPLQCRSYPYWSSVFESNKELKYHQKKCPGFDREAPEISTLQIVRRINQTLKKFNEQQKNPREPLVL
ncbi:MAG: YkgJ family cysteine cluster protein [Spirochaetia bacterium]|nr:YkgJ family cysteine cluster protein [Spirochaetia bacterium]